MLSPVRLSVCLPVCLSSVTLVYATQRVEIFGNVSTKFGTWPSIDIRRKFYGDRPRGTPSSGGLNTRGVAKSKMDLSKAISRKRCKIGGTLVLITNRKSHMRFRLVPKSVTLNYPERSNGPYFALFHRIR